MKFKFNQKVVALAAAGLVLLSGATVTSLAAWTDTEWVNGGVATLPGLGAATFDVQQNVTNGASTGWSSQETSPGGVVNFGAAASGLTPNTSVYGFVRLRTVVNSLAGTLTLQHETDTSGSAFLSALQYGAWLKPAGSTCTSANYNTGTELVPDGSSLTKDSTVPFILAAGTSTLPGTEQVVCFKVTFPALTDPSDKTLQGALGDPIWQFSAVSN